METTELLLTYSEHRRKNPWIADEVRDLQMALETTVTHLLGKRMIVWESGVWILTFLGHVALAALGKH